MPCSHDRVVRLSVPDDGDYWICTACNEQFVGVRAVNWKIAHLAKEVLRLQGIERMCSSLAVQLENEFAISPCYDEETQRVLMQWRVVKGSNEQAAGMWYQEALPFSA